MPHSIAKEVQAGCVVMFSKSQCHYCKLAQTVFDAHGIRAKNINLGMKERSVSEDLVSFTDCKTVTRKCLELFSYTQILMFV